MKPVKTIRLKGSMASKALKKVFEVLQDDRKEPQILFVGGCVRNAILGEEVSDIDLATKWTPQDVVSKLKKAGIKVVPTGIDHGTVTAVCDGEHFQITTLRKDIDTDGRRAKVAFTDDWLADARRRDFTFNTLLADQQGRIYDPLGIGLKDLERRKVVFVGEAVTRIREDYLRILRFFRFHAWYGKGQPMAKGLEACVMEAHGLKTLSKERVTQEIFKILLSQKAGTVLALMQDHKILKPILNLKFESSYFNALKKIDKLNSVILGLLILANFSKFGTMRIEKSLRLSNSEKKQLDRTVFYLKKFKEISDHELKVLLYRAGHEVAELVLISRLLLSKASSATSQKWICKLRKTERPILPIRGQDLIDQGKKPGPGIRLALKRFELAWIRRGFT